MSENTRRPQAFSLDDADVLDALEELEVDKPADLVPVETSSTTSSPKKRWLTFARLFWVGLTGLVTTAISVWMWSFIDSLFLQHVWLGWFATGLLAFVIIGLVGVLLHELAALRRLDAMEQLQDEAKEAHQTRAPKQAKAIVKRLMTLYGGRPDLAKARVTLASHSNDVIDGPDLIEIAEAELLKPLDTEARTLIIQAARRASVVTAVSPRAVLDMIYVFAEMIWVLRTVSRHYGARPGSLAMVRLLKHAVGNLAATGTIALGDSVIEQLFGHGITSRLSTRLGEGVFNGFLIARFGVAVTMTVRPLPFIGQTPPKPTDIMRGIISTAGLTSGSRSDPKNS